MDNCKEAEWISDVSEKHVNEMLDRIISTLYLMDLRRHTILIHGTGKHPKSSYKTILREYKGSIGKVVYKPLLGKYLFFLRPVIANYRGLIEVKDIQKVKELFLLLMKLSMVQLFVLPTEAKNRYFDEFDQHFKRVDMERIGECDLFSYTVDADNVESESGIVEIFSYGFDCDERLKKIKSSPLLPDKNAGLN